MSLDGTVASADHREGAGWADGRRVLSRSDGTGEFGEDCCELMLLADIHAEFVVAATKVLDERMPSTDHLCRAESFQAAYGP